MGRPKATYETKTKTKTFRFKPSVLDMLDMIKSYDDSYTNVLEQLIKKEYEEFMAMAKSEYEDCIQEELERQHNIELELIKKGYEEFDEEMKTLRNGR